VRGGRQRRASVCLARRLGAEIRKNQTRQKLKFSRSSARSTRATDWLADAATPTGARRTRCRPRAADENLILS